MSEHHVQVAGPEEVLKPTPLFEAAVILSLVVAILCLVLFAWLGREMLEGDTLRFDGAVRSWVHHFSSPAMTRAINEISALGYGVLIIELLIAVAVFSWLRWSRAAI